MFGFLASSPLVLLFFEPTVQALFLVNFLFFLLCLYWVQRSISFFSFKFPCLDSLFKMQLFFFLQYICLRLSTDCWFSASQHETSLKSLDLDNSTEESINKKLMKVYSTFLFCMNELGVWLAMKVLFK